jgi:hypothetical protein
VDVFAAFSIPIAPFREDGSPRVMVSARGSPLASVQP